MDVIKVAFPLTQKTLDSLSKTVFVSSVIHHGLLLLAISSLELSIDAKQSMRKQTFFMTLKSPTFFRYKILYFVVLYKMVVRLSLYTSWWNTTRINQMACCKFSLKPVHNLMEIQVQTYVYEAALKVHEIEIGMLFTHTLVLVSFRTVAATTGYFWICFYICKFY